MERYATVWGIQEARQAEEAGKWACSMTDQGSHLATALRLFELRIEVGERTGELGQSECHCVGHNARAGRR